MSRLGHSGLADAESMARLERAVTHQSTLLAVNDLFWLSGWLFLVLVVSVWLAKKPVAAGPVAAH